MPFIDKGKIMSNTGTAEAKTFKRPDGLEGANIEFVRPSKLAEAGMTGLIVEGIYTGSTPNNYDAAKKDYRFETTDSEGNEKTVVINGAGNLAYQMDAIQLNTLVQVNYLGKSKIKKGKMAGKEAHNFEVLVAE
jgi:hypothetical protein